jgi:hypothetical protein
MGLIIMEKRSFTVERVFGTEMDCEIFIGPVYYQRLRHMVSHKFQVIVFCSILNRTYINIFMHSISIRLAHFNSFKKNGAMSFLQSTLVNFSLFSSVLDAGL